MQYHVIDVFTDKLFGGNPAGVVLLDQWLTDATMQSIAAENNISETAFLVKRDDYYELRWFTPTIEVDLCGHATLASAFVLFDELEKESSELHFKTKSGILRASRYIHPQSASVNQYSDKDPLYIDLPARRAMPCPIYPAWEKALGFKPAATYKASDFLVLAENEEAVRNIKPDFFTLRELKAEAGLESNDFGTIVTARGDDCDFVSRFFAPNAGVDEDPVTGRAHCTLIPYWGYVTQKNLMTARQLSKRGGMLFCEYLDDNPEDGVCRVSIGGSAVRYLKGEFYV